MPRAWARPLVGELLASCRKRICIGVLWCVVVAVAVALAVAVAVVCRVSCVVCRVVCCGVVCGDSSKEIHGYSCRWSACFKHLATLTFGALRKI